MYIQVLGVLPPAQTDDAPLVRVQAGARHTAGLRHNIYGQMIGDVIFEYIYKKHDNSTKRVLCHVADPDQAESGPFFAGFGYFLKDPDRYYLPWLVKFDSINKNGIGTYLNSKFFNLNIFQFFR